MVDTIIALVIIGVAAVLLFWLGKTKSMKPVTKKHILLFVAGAEAFHSLTHLYLWFSNQTFVVPWLVVTSGWNLGSGIVNGLVAIGLLYWASKIKN